MQYMLLIYEDEAQWARLSPAEQQASIGRHGAFAGRLREEGRLVAGDPLHPSGTATCVRNSDDEVLIIDGPYAETKEQLAGYYIISATNLDQALADAARVPMAVVGLVEVRPLLAL